MKLLMAANWKMYKTGEEAVATLTALGQKLSPPPEGRQVVVFVPFTALAPTGHALAAFPAISMGAQNCYPAKEGAFTGETSPGMIQAAGGSWVLTGHSERRALFQESDEFVGRKTAFALQAGLNVVLCIGETLQERDGGRLQHVLERQLGAGLADVEPSQTLQGLAVAYEPVWAIGTGRVAGAPEIVEAHTVIRTFLKRKYAAPGKEVRILYGGSVKPDNAGEIIRLDNVNGVLVGGASLQAETFSSIVLA